MTTINKNNYTLFEKHNLEIGLFVFYVVVDVMASQFEGKEIARMHKSLKQSYVSKYFLEREKKGCFVTNFQ